MARTPLRAWNGKIKNIDDLMAWLYDQEIMNKTDRERKDVVFRQYYRYYNDGDAPRGVLSKYKISMYQEKEVEAKLEEYLCDFISAMLKKYQGKYSRKDFYIDRKISKLKTLISVAERWDAYSLFNYWVKDVVEGSNSNLRGLIGGIETYYEMFRKALDEELPDKTGNTASFLINDSKNKISDDVRKQYKVLQGFLISFVLETKIVIAEIEACKARRAIA